MQNHEPIWFDKKEKKSDDIKFSVFVGTPCHSDVSIHYTQSVLELQKALGKLILKRKSMSDDNPNIKRIDGYIKQLRKKLNLTKN